MPIALLQKKIETATHLEEKEQLQRELARLLKVFHAVYTFLIFNAKKQKRIMVS